MGLFDRLKGKRLLITGASSGIGEATARLFAEATNGDVTLILTARRYERLESLKSGILAQYPLCSIFLFKLDVSDCDAINKFGEEYSNLLSTVDILVNNAGFSHGLYPVGAIPHKDILAVINTNLTGLIALTQILVPHFKAKNEGDVVNITSISGRDHYGLASTYCTTKAAVSAFSDVLRQETKDTGIRVIEVLPGLVETEFATVRNEGNAEKAAKVYQVYKCLEARDVAEQIAWATSRAPHVQIAETLILPTNQASMHDADMLR